MSTSISNDILAQLQGGSLSQIARQLGTSEQQASDAIQTALPVLLGALGQNAQNPAGAQALFGAIQRDHAGAAAAPMGGGGGLDVSDLLGSLFGGAGGGALLGSVLGGASDATGGSAGTSATASRQFNAEGILGHILGGKTSRAESGLSQATGLSQDHIHKLLLMLAPIVMGYLGRQVGSGKAGSADVLGQLLGQERQQAKAQGGMAGGLLNMLDQDGDGRFDAGDLFKLGSSLLKR